MIPRSEAALWREHGRVPPAHPLPTIVPAVATPLPPACWESRPLIIECLATGEPLAAVARMLGLAGVDALAEVLRAHGLERTTTAGGALVIAGRPT